MPTYEYQCSNCHKTFETVQKITEDPLKVCLLCGKEGVKRLISATAFHLKGSGWYKTDYSSSGSGGSSSSSATSSGSSSSETKTETKTESASKPAETKSSSETAPAKTSGGSSGDS